MVRNCAFAAFISIVALASPALAHETTNLRMESNKAVAASPMDALSVTMPNPVHTWKDEKTGTFYAQNQVFLSNNDPTRAVCDVEFAVPVDEAAETRVESSYVSNVKTGKSGLTGDLPEYAEKIMPNESVNLGYLISGPSASAVKMGDFKVTAAEWCEEDK
ncbi:Hypothetical protein NocV09_01200190 [Nannochloropsis oceanica]